MTQLPQMKMMRALSMNAENNVSDLLNALSDEVNRLYGYVKTPGDNFGEPAINSGPCGPFANAFLNLWNQSLSKRHILFL
jgi:hypothetical protein